MKNPFASRKKSDLAAKQITILIADDHPVVRDGIKNELAQHSDLLLLGEAVNGDEALGQAKALKPDVLVLDINMPGKKAVQVVRELKLDDEAPRILVLSAYGDLDSVQAMLKAGVAGYLLKDEDPSRITEGIRRVASGDTWLSSAVAERIVEGTIRQPSPKPEPQLSPREEEVINLLAQGFSNEQICDELSITMGTVKNHVSHVYSKLGVNSRAEAVVWWWEHRRGAS